MARSASLLDIEGAQALLLRPLPLHPHFALLEAGKLVWSEPRQRSSRLTGDVLVSGRTPQQAPREGCRDGESAQIPGMHDR